MSFAPLEDVLKRNGPKVRLAIFMSAVNNQQPVVGLTHNFYRCPACFSPLFARAAIEVFSRPGDVVRSLLGRRNQPCRGASARAA